MTAASIAGITALVIAVGHAAVDIINALRNRGQ